MAKDLDAKLKEMDEKIKQIQDQKRELIKKTKSEERKKRNHELIQIGATLGSIGIKTLEQVNQLKAFLLKNPEILHELAKLEEKASDENNPSENMSPE